jgi:hypothetical protein
VDILSKLNYLYAGMAAGREAKYIARVDYWQVATIGIAIHSAQMILSLLSALVKRRKR